MAICLAFSICLKAVWLKRFDSVTSVPHVETVISEMGISREIMRDIFNNNLADANLLCNVRLYRLNVLASAHLPKKSRVKTSRVSNRIPTWTGNKSVNAGKRDLTNPSPSSPYWLTSPYSRFNMRKPNYRDRLMQPEHPNPSFSSTFTINPADFSDRQSEASSRSCRGSLELVSRGKGNR